MGIHYDYKSTRSAKLMEKQAKREKKLAEKKAKRLAKDGIKEIRKPFGISPYRFKSNWASYSALFNFVLCNKD